MNYRTHRLRQLILDAATLNEEGILFDFSRLADKDYTNIEKLVAESIITDETTYTNDCLKIMHFVNSFGKVYPSIYYLKKIKMAFLYYKDNHELLYVFEDEIDTAITNSSKLIKAF